MTDPAGVKADPRPVLMMGDEPDTADALMRLADKYALVSFCSHSFTRAKKHPQRAELEAAIRAALEAA